MSEKADLHAASYLVPARYGEAELIEKRSRFIARVWPLDTEEQALARLSETRERHRDASHNVYAYVIRDGNLMRYSDDGEPGGSSGLPTLNVFRAGEIFDFCCVVTRWFGGTLLGTGGLARAYSGAAKLALEAAGISEMALWRPYSLECSYKQYEQLTRLLAESGASQVEADFGAAVSVCAYIPSHGAPDFEERLRERFAGAVKANCAADIFMAVRMEKSIS